MFYPRLPSKPKTTEQASDEYHEKCRLLGEAVKEKPPWKDRLFIILFIIFVLGLAIFWVGGWLYTLDATGEEFPLTSILRKVFSNGK